MSERKKAHNGRDLDGHFKVKKEDVDELRTEPNGADIMRDDIRLGGAVEDTGVDAGTRGAHIAALVEENRADVKRMTQRDSGSH